MAKVRDNGVIRQGGSQATGSLGLNVVGYLNDETGVGEAARAILRALDSLGFPIACTTVRSYGARKSDRSLSHLPVGHPYGINLVHVNADQVPVVYKELGSSFFAGKHNIGFWFWEAEPFPEQWLDRFDLFNEIWVASSAVQNTLARVAPIPVIRMGIPLCREPAPDASRADLGLPENRFLFLFSFDMLSVFERKNPLGLVEAYRRAFGPSSTETTLVLKATNLDRFPKHHRQLTDAIGSVSGVLIDRYMDRPELDSLYVACDAYVSLHRYEGLGMTMAEAMCLGKPTIATGYSGNLDFMTPQNSYLVDCSLVELDRDYGPYRKGSVWAEPDLDHAALLMRQAFEAPDDAVLKGKRASSDIGSLHSSEVIAHRVIGRLRAIESFRRAQDPSSLVRKPRTALSKLPLTSQAEIPEQLQACLEDLRETAVVESHLPIAWPTWPKGFWSKAVALVKKAIRRLLRWYINPIIEQQNRFNLSVVDTLDTITRLQSRIEAQSLSNGPEPGEVDE